ncbi:trypsin-like serine peptidase [Hyphococcus sp.]|uniref:trypsin-like serine peptidase n=1 Tax=Hyphococcus sp. TaxID=2038636 RepID=UPI0037503B1A
MDRQKGNIVGRLLPALALGGAVVALFAFEATRYSEIRRLQDRTAVLQDDIDDARSKAEAALAAIIAPETIAAATRSVYLIVVNGKARGTAFVIDREHGLLATAGHTADSLPLDDADAEVYVLNRNSGATFKVTSKQIHAGFGAFRTLVEDYQPIRKNSSVYAPQAAPLRDLAFDAALIRVAAINPATGENQLGPDLPIASEDQLLALDSGAAIAVIGYPYDTLDDGFAPDAATPRAERGVIAAMTPPLDTASEIKNPVIANLIIHRLATAGGNSGSPILNAKGEVIGIHTHGIESASSNADGAAQRAEVLFDLLSPEREQKRLNEVFLPAWNHLIAHWARAEDALSWSFYMEYARPGETPAPRVQDFDSIAATPFQRSTETLEFEAAAETRRLEAPDLKTVQPESSEGVDVKPAAFVIKEPGQYAEFWRTVDRRSEHVLFAFDYSLRSKIGFCPLTAYWRKKGDTRLQVARKRASFELHMPALKDGGVEDYQILLRRDAQCDPVSAQFISAAVSWPSPSSGGAQSVSYIGGADANNQGRVQNWVKYSSQAIEKLGRSWVHFKACKLASGPEDPDCAAPEFIELEQTPAPE